MFVDNFRQQIVAMECAENWREIQQIIRKFKDYDNVKKITIIIDDWKFSLTVQQKNIIKLLPHVEIISCNLLNPFDNELQSEFILEKDQEEEYILPVILRTDPVAVFLGLQEGEVVKIIRKNGRVYKRKCRGHANIFLMPNFMKKKNLVLNENPVVVEEITMMEENNKEKCSKCNSHNIRLLPLQTRRADEGTTIFRQCLNCHHIWKF